MAVVKAQIHAGGRGKGTIQDIPAQRGVQLVRSREEAETVAANILGHQLVTIQTGPEGQDRPPRAGRRRLLDRPRALSGRGRRSRPRRGPVLIVSSEGGMDIEHVAATTPERILTRAVRRRYGRCSPTRSASWPGRLGLPQAALRSAEQFVQALSKLFLARDCSLLEINPLVLTADNRLLALDAKMSFDDNALFRHADLAGLRDLAEEEPAEVRAGEAGLSYVQARRQHRLPGQRRRPGHEHDGPDQAPRRRSRPTSSTSAAGPTCSR